MTPTELKNSHQEHHPCSLFFSQSIMRFFGDTMANYGVRSEIVNGIDCWELYRKKPVKFDLQSSHYFTKGDFAHITRRDQ